MIKKTTHTALHTLFSNQIFPEQITTLINISSKALLPEVAMELMKVLQERDIHSPEEWYKEDCIRLPKSIIRK